VFYRQANSEEGDGVADDRNTENGDAAKPSGPIEVWIREKKTTGFTCVVVYADKFTHEFDLVSQTLAAAQQEVTRRLMPVGYQPAGRWSPVETSRTFKPGEPPRGKPVPRRRVLNTAREWGMWPLPMTPVVAPSRSSGVAARRS
jgi:hypothetical protein